jgi:hypothetical protein
MTKRKIKEGEEITYHYGKEYFDLILRKQGCQCVKCLEEKAAQRKNGSKQAGGVKRASGVKRANGAKRSNGAKRTTGTKRTRATVTGSAKRAKRAGRSVGARV